MFLADTDCTTPYENRFTPVRTGFSNDMNTSFALLGTSDKGIESRENTVPETGNKAVDVSTQAFNVVLKHELGGSVAAPEMAGSMWLDEKIRVATTPRSLFKYGTPSMFALWYLRL